MKGRFRNQAMNELLGVMLTLMGKKNVTLDTVWVSTTEMESLGCDRLSRGIFEPEGYTVAKNMVEKLRGG